MKSEGTFDGDTVDELPEVYDPVTWPKNLPTPLSYVQQLKNKIKSLSVTFKESEDSKLNFRKYVCTVKLKCEAGILEHVYDPSSIPFFSQIKQAQQASAHQFILDPPDWLALILEGGIPDFSKNQKEGEEKKREDTNNGDDELRPINFNQILNPMKSEVSLSSDEIDISKIANFTHEEYNEELKNFPERFVDVGGDGRMIVKKIKMGTRYPETGAPITVSICIKRQDNKVIENTKSSEFKFSEGGLIPCLMIILSNMQIGEEVLAMSTYHNAFGESGIVQCPLIGPKESILIYAHLISSAPYIMYTQEIDEIKSTPIDERIEQAKRLKETGNNFYNKKLYKFALDQYINGLRRLKVENKLYCVLPKSTQKRLDLLLAELNSNVATVYANKGFNGVDPPSDTNYLTLLERETQYSIIQHCKISLRIQPDNIKVLLRCARARVYIQEFDKAREFREKVRAILDQNKEENERFFKIFKIENEFAKRKEFLYEQKSIQMEKKMGSFFNKPDTTPNSSNFQKPNSSENEIQLKKKIKDEVRKNYVSVFDEDLIEVVEKSVIEVDSEGNPTHDEDKPKSAFSIKEITNIKIDSLNFNHFNPVAVGDSDGKKKLNKKKEMDEIYVDDNESEDDDGEPRITMFGEPAEFLNHLLQFNSNNNKNNEDKENEDEEK